MTGTDGFDHKRWSNCHPPSLSSLPGRGLLLAPEVVGGHKNHIHSRDTLGGNDVICFRTKVSFNFGIVEISLNSVNETSERNRRIEICRRHLGQHSFYDFISSRKPRLLDLRIIQIRSRPTGRAGFKFASGRVEAHHPLLSTRIGRAAIGIWRHLVARYSIGFDFGTESVRVLVVDVSNGHIAAQAAHAYAHGVIDQTLPTSGEKLPPDYALQHPQDWLDSAGHACRAAMRTGAVAVEDVVGIGVDFTSCTMLPTLADGTPLCLTERFGKTPLAWPKLWKHHGAKAEADRINQIAQERNESWLARYGGTIGLEWFFPKALETLNHAPDVYDAARSLARSGRLVRVAVGGRPIPQLRRRQPDPLHLPGGIQGMLEQDERLSLHRFLPRRPPRSRNHRDPKNARARCKAPAFRPGVSPEKAPPSWDYTPEPPSPPLSSTPMPASPAPASPRPPRS